MGAYTPPHTVHGNGPHRVIALHGWFGDHRAYEPIWPHLNTAAFSYAFMDNRGYGRARDQAGEFNMEEVAAQV